MLKTLKNPSVSAIRDTAPCSRRVLGKYAAAWMLLFVSFAQGQAVDLIKAIDSAKKTVAPIVCLVKTVDAKEPKDVIRFQIEGTAFMVDAVGTFVTANHVIIGMLTAPLKDICLPAITFPPHGWARTDEGVKWFAFPAGQCQSNLTFDIAICKTQSDLSKETGISYSVASISGDKPPDGTAVFFTGFPLQATDPITSIGAVAGFSAQDGYNTILIDKNAWPGASGSPIYLSDGETVIGIVLRAGGGDASGLSLGGVGQRIIEILANARNNWKQAENQKQAPPSPPK